MFNSPKELLSSPEGGCITFFWTRFINVHMERSYIHRYWYCILWSKSNQTKIKGTYIMLTLNTFMILTCVAVLGHVSRTIPGKSYIDIVLAGLRLISESCSTEMNLLNGPNTERSNGGGNERMTTPLSLANLIVPNPISECWFSSTKITFAPCKMLHKCVKTPWCYPSWWIRWSYKAWGSIVDKMVMKFDPRKKNNYWLDAFPGCTMYIVTRLPRSPEINAPICLTIFRPTGPSFVYCLQWQPKC